MKSIIHKKPFSSFSTLLILVAVAIIVSIVFSGCSKTTEQPTQEPPKMKMTTEMPAGILTPNHIDSRIGELNSVDGVPTPETVTKIYDNLDYHHALQSFLAGIQIASIDAMSVTGDLKLCLCWPLQNALFSSRRSYLKGIFFMLFFIYQIISLGYICL